MINYYSKKLLVVFPFPLAHLTSCNLLNLQQFNFFKGKGGGGCHTGSKKQSLWTVNIKIHCSILRNCNVTPSAHSWTAESCCLCMLGNYNLQFEKHCPKLGKLHLLRGDRVPCWTKTGKKGKQVAFKKNKTHHKKRKKKRRKKGTLFVVVCNCSLPLHHKLQTAP